MSSERARTLVDSIASTCTQDTGQDMSSSLGYPHHHDGQGHGHDDEGRKQILKNLMIENEMKPVVSGGGSGTQDEEMRSALGYPDHGDGSDDEGRKRSNMENLQMKKEKKPAPASVPFLRLFHFASGVDYLLLILGTLGSIVHGAVLPAFLYYFGDLINSFGSYQNDPVRMASEVAKYSLAFVYVGIATLIASWIDVACWMHSAERQATKMRSAYLEAILRQDIGFFDTDVDTGSLVDSISLDTVLVQDAIGEKMGSFIHCMATFVGGFVVGFISYWKIALVMLAVLPAIAFAGGLYAYTLTKLSTQSQNAYGKAGSIAEQALTQIRTVFSFVGESKTLTAYSECLKVTVQLGYKGGMAKGLGIGVTSGIIFCSWALILWYSGILVRRNETNGGKAISAIFAVIIGGMSVGQGMSNVTAFAKGKASLQTIMAIIEKKPKMDCKLTDGTTLFDVKGNIEFHNVAFSYPSRPNIKIFNNFSLHIPSGKTIAIVGGSGSGKSTVVSLIERFYDPIEGEVRLDGVDICMLQLKWLRDQIGLVNQEPALFATSIKENILYGNPGASDEDIEQAAKAANVHGFISQLPEGYETQVGERGVQLSGGQKQRIAIGRAMLKNPKILLLDEATSALDYASEQVVQEALNDLMVGRTTVVVAHRLSTIRNVDTIAVVQKGKIVEMGSHEELMTKGMNGTYAALVTLQEMAMSNDGTILTHESRISNHLADPSAISRSFRGSSSPRLSSGRTLSNRYSSGSERYELDGHKTMVEKGKNKQDGNPRKSVYRRLAKLNSPEWPYAVLGTLGAVLSGFVNPAFALLVSEMISVYYNPDFSQMKADIQKYTLIFVGMGVLAAAVYFLQHYYFGIVGENLTGRVREMMLEAILKNEVGWFDMDENSSARLGARLSTDATNVRGAIGDLVALLVQSSSAFLTAIVIGLVLEWRLALVLLATFPLLVGAALAQQFLLKGFAGDLEVVHSRATRVAGEVVVNIRTVAAFNAESQVLHLFASELSSLQNQSFLRGNIAGVGFGIAQFCMFSSYGLALWYGSTLVKSGTSEFGPIIKVFFVLIVSAFSVAEALGLAPDFAKGGQALESVFSIIDRKTLIDPDDKDENVTAMQSIEGDIEFHHVEFAYPTRPEVILFKDFNLKVKAGQSVALVGASGSGKSSVISLIERFYDPIAGRVLIDGIDIKKLHLKSLRLHIGLVQQEPALFNESIYSNIVYGREGASQAEVERAAKAANAHGFISGLEEGYRTLVGERGSQLSGGQKQRIAIARAILKEPSILLLDEATSALDAASEKVVQEALGAVMKGRTSVVVAHQLSTVRNASVIAVVQEGKIIEMGSHSELMNIPHGSYARLLNLQSRNHHPV